MTIRQLMDLLSTRCEAKTDQRQDQSDTRDETMAHRDGSGNKIEDLAAAQKSWREAGRSITTYCSKREWDNYQEDFGELVASSNGIELRRHASVKVIARGGSMGIAHNRILIGNPAQFASWLADERPQNEKGWVAQWTYYPDNHLEAALLEYKRRTTTD